jgi:O-antigen ligase
VKWGFLAVALAAIVPLVGWLRRNPRETPKIWMLMGFLPFGVGAFHLYMAAISWPGWPGYVKGAEISVLDLLALALYLSLPHKGFALPFRLSMALYFLAVVLSAFQTPVPMASLFYAWQLARMFLVYAVVANACVDERVAPALLTGMAIGLCYEACVAIWQRFGLGVLQTGGSLGHQNFLGLMSHFVVFPWLALLLAGERGWRPALAALAGLVVAALTVSRATIGLVGAGCVALFAVSALRRWTPRKALLLVAGAAAAGIITPIVLSSLQQRFAKEAVTNYDERAALERAAGMIVSDYPMGIGANYYIVVANTEHYNTKAGVAQVLTSDSANVHNVYYLVAAETGYFGLIAFVLMLLQPLIVAFRCGWRNRADRRGDLLLGFGMALFILYVHSYFEWIFVTFAAQYMFALEAGMVAGLAMQLGYWRRSAVGNRVATVGAIATTAKVAQN